MIDRDKNIIHIHIPKTAGTSIENALFGAENMTMENLYTQPVFPNRFKVCSLQHLWAREIKVLIKDFDNYFKFTFVRNPYDRAVSLYYFFIKRLEINLSPLEFFSNIRTIKRHHPYELQYDYIHDNGKLLVDFIGKFETLKIDFDYIYRKINNSEPPELKCLLKTENRPSYRDFIKDIQTKKLIENIYKKDFETFGYSYE